MKTVTPEKYCECVKSIYDEKPKYQSGHDGSDGKCDCIGMCRGALIRAGVTGVSGMGGTNYAARHTIKDLKKISNVKELKLGDVVLKERDKDDPDMKLPDQYRKGGDDYNKTWGETNFTHIGTVTREYPNLQITHMTSPTAMIDDGLKNWKYTGHLPWVEKGAEEQEPEPAAEWVYVYAENGKPVKMRAKPSSNCRTYWEVPNGSQVVLVTKGDEWSEIIWAGRSAWMMSKFLRAELVLYRVTTEGVTEETAKEIIKKYGGTMTKI